MKKILKILFNRMFIVGLLIVLQVLFLILFAVKLNDYFIYIHILSIVISLLIMFTIIYKNTEPSFKVLWAILIITFPIVGIFLFFLVGDNKLKKKSVKISNKLSNEVKDIYKNNYPHYSQIHKELENVDKLISTQSNYITNTTYMPLYKNTQTEFLPIGEVFFERLVEELKKAKHFIFMEFFILTEGKMLNTIIDILAQKVKEGIDVRVMYDDLGSIYALRNNYDKYLQSLGIQCTIFNKFVPIISIGHNNRDHRKIVVIDGYIGFTGGINLADEYINEYEKYGHWKDTGILLVGEAVKSLTLMFLQSWYCFSKQDSDFLKFLPQIDYDNIIKSDGYVQPYGDTPLDSESVSENVYLNIINQATKYVYITTPYLIIDYTMVNALRSAAQRGIDVRIITPHIPDKKIAFSLTQSFYSVLINAGVKIYEYTPGFIHAKGFVCDDKVGTVGTVNLDYRSFCHHFECGVWLYNASSINSIKEDFLDTQNKSMLITKDMLKDLPLKNRILSFIVKFLAPLF